jgi:hypothetical protein
MVAMAQQTPVVVVAEEANSAAASLVAQAAPAWL